MIPLRLQFIFPISILIIFSIGVSACSFKSPSAREGQVLLERGAFPSSVPSWVNQSASRNPRISSAGFIPRGYGVPPSVAASRNRGGSSQNVAQTGVKEILKNAEKRDAMNEKGGNPSFDKGDVEEESSPLDRIAEKCPQVENDVTQALQMTDINARIKKYEILSRRCSSSADLWIWLGRDYKAIGELRDAKRCLERALVAEPSNAEAEELLLEVNTKLAG